MRQLVDSPVKVQALDAVVVDSMQTRILELVASDLNPSVRMKACHVIGSIAASYEGANVQVAQAWPQLLPATLQLAGTKTDAKVCETGLLLLAKLGEYSTQMITAAKSEVLPVLSNAFQLSGGLSMDGKVYLTQATINLLLCLDAEQLAQCESVMEPLLSTLSELLQSGDELSAQDSMKSLIDLVCDEGVCKFMPQGMVHLSEAMLTVASTANFESSTRQLALEALTSLVDITPGSVRKRTDFVMRMVKSIILMLAEEGDCDDDFDFDIFTEYVESERDKESMFGSATDALNRMCCKLGGRVVLPTVFGTSPGLIADQTNWRNRRAGVVAISSSCTGAKKMLKPQLGKLFQMVLPLIQNDADQRVRYFATMAVGQMLTDFEGTVQETLHADVVPVMGTALYENSGNCNHVRATVAYVLTTFAAAELCPSTAILPYLQPLLEGLFSVLNAPNVHFSVQEQTIDAIAKVAVVAGENFGDFYDGFMPAAKAIISQATSPEVQELRGKTMECVALIGEAVGRVRFFEDAKQVLELMLTAQTNSNEFPGFEHIMSASTRICRAIGDGFLPYLQYVIPGLLAKVSSETGASIVDVVGDEDKCDTDDADSGMSSVVLDVKGMGKKRITLNTNDVLEKEIAIRALYEYFDVLEQHMGPYAEEVAVATCPLIVYKYSPQIRDVAALLAPKIVNALGGAHGNAQNVINSTGYMIPNLLVQLQKETNMDVLCSTSEAVKETMRLLCESGGKDENGKFHPAKYLLPMAMSSKVTEVVCDAANKSAIRRNEAMKDAKEKGFDEEDYENLEEEFESEEELMTNFVDTCGYILKMHKSDFLPLFDAYPAPVFIPLLQPHNPTTLRHNAMCIFIDVIEHCGTGAHKYLDMMLPAAMQYATDSESYMRQAAVYGLRIASEQAQTQFSQYVMPVLGILATLVQAEDSHNADNACATENAVAAIGTICKFHGDAIHVLHQMLPLWMANLPLQEDEECAQMTATHLCEFLQTRTHMLLGAQFEHASIAVSAMTQILVGCNGGGEDSIELATPQTKQNMQSLLAQMATSLPSDAKNAAWQALNGAQKHVLQSVLPHGVQFMA
jgi:hypothetical protein